MLRSDNRARLRRRDVTVVFLDAGPAFLASRVEGKAAPAAPARRRAGPRRPRPGCTPSGRRSTPRSPTSRSAVEPFHAREEKPKRALAERIAELVVAHEAQGDGVITVEVVARRPHATPC